MRIRDERGSIDVELIIMGLLAFALVGVTFWVVRFSTNTISSMAAKMDKFTVAWETGEVTQGVAEKVGDYTTIGEKITGKETYQVEVRYTVDGVDYTRQFLIDSVVFSQIDGDDQDGQGVVEIHYDPNDPSIGMMDPEMINRVVLGE